MKKVFFVVALVVLFCGCAPVISKDMLREVHKDVTFGELLKGPQAYTGTVVLLGGIIVKTENRQEGTLLEIYQTELDRRGRPIRIDVSEGRFLALYKGLLEREIYRKGRKVTVAGVVQGEKVMKLGELEYHYPYLLVKEIHLWRQEPVRAYEPYPWGPWDPWWGDPWFPWYPWYDPFWRHRYYRH